MPKFVIELVVRLLLGLVGSPLIKLEVTVRYGLQLHKLGIHCPQVIDARSPLLVELLLHDSLALIFSPSLELIGSHGHFVHALLWRLLTVHHLLLVRLHLRGELLRELPAPLLQVCLVLGLQIGSLALDAVGADNGLSPVLPEALLLHLEGIQLLGYEGLVGKLLLLPLDDRSVGAHTDGDRRCHRHAADRVRSTAQCCAKAQTISQLVPPPCP
mmetsp:Transcript_111890/g.347140  ORF Transcript_111890/g.347140 Transcript_111890/m.347140 type:complete len:214 (+) Transcript_111890:1029-1670(+)